MKRKVQFGMLMVLAAATLLAAQGRNAMQVLADVRSAIGGDAKVADVKTLSATGHVVRINAQGPQAPSDVEMAIALPDKFVKKDVLASFGDNVITHSQGFNGDGLIDATDAPPASADGATRTFIRLGPGMGNMTGQPSTPEEAEKSRITMLASSRQEFTRLVLGMLGTPAGGYPITFGAVTEENGPAGPADVVSGTAPDGFSLKFYVDSSTHRPVMVSWMAKEPLRMTMTPNGRGGVSTTTTGQSGFSSSQGNAVAMSPEDRDRMMQDLTARMNAAEANRRVVEYALHYGGFLAVDGLTMPTTFEETIDGKSVETLTLDHIRVNPKIDPSRFAVTKK